MLLILAFAVILLLTFFLASWVMRPTRLESEMEQRLDGLAGVKGSTLPSAHTLDEFLAKPPRNRFQWIEDITERTAIAGNIRLLLIQAGSTRSVGDTLLLAVALPFGAALIAWLFTHLGLIALVAAAIAAYIPIGFLKFQRSRRLARFEGVLADSIDMCVRALRAGHSIVAALGIMAEQTLEPAKTEFAEVYKKQTYGLSMRDALNQMLERMPSADLRVVVAGILVQRESGGNLAELLDRVSVVLRKRAKVQGEIRTNTAQGRMTGWILCLLPPILLLVIDIMTPGYSDVLVKDPTGRKMLYAGVVLLGLGALAIRQIVNGIEV